jgi:hypothetical protein
MFAQIQPTQCERSFLVGTISKFGSLKALRLENTAFLFPSAQVAQIRGDLEKVSSCSTALYQVCFLVRNEEAEGSNPLSSTNLPK